MIVDIDNRSRDFDLSQDLADRIHIYMKAALEIEGFDDEVEVSLSFVDEEEIQDLNKTYRGKDSVTDVLSFPSWDEFSGTLGDVVICTSRARDQAEEIGNSLDDELVYLVVHSMFHLLGYDHMDEGEKKEMRDREKLALKLGGKRDGYKKV